MFDTRTTALALRYDRPPARRGVAGIRGEVMSIRANNNNPATLPRGGCGKTGYGACTGLSCMISRTGYAGRSKCSPKCKPGELCTKDGCQTVISTSDDPLGRRTRRRLASASGRGRPTRRGSRSFKG